MINMCFWDGFTPKKQYQRFKLCDSLLEDADYVHTRTRKLENLNIGSIFEDTNYQ